MSAAREEQAPPLRWDGKNKKRRAVIDRPPETVKKLTLQLTDTGQRGSARGARPASQYNNLPSKDLIYQGF